jgi:succinate-semialdehyde dehydrogenase / glutarate-semialdehyde dehydrogenase
MSTAATMADVVPRLSRLASRVTAAPGAACSAVVAPFTGEVIGQVPQSSPADVEIAFASARAAARAWSTVPSRARAAVALAFHDIVLSRRSELLDVIQAETGKARMHAFEEILDVAIVSRYYGRTAPGYLARRRRRGAFPILTEVVERQCPLGVVGVIAPWNYPLTLSAGDAIPALLAGNAVVIKPDPRAPLTALLVAELLADAGLPDGVLHVVTGGEAIGAAVVDHADFVCFTGSTGVGRTVARRCAERLIGCSLELGGKNPMLVCADADLNRAVRGAVHACFSSAGQLCVSTERLYVDAEVYDRFVPAFVAATERLELGVGFDFGPDMGALISTDHLDRVRSHVDAAVRAGARVLTGGHARPDLGPTFYEPTILESVTPEMAVCREETFGPVVSVYPFQTEDEAVLRANDSVFGLNASVWTSNVARGRRLAARLRAGTVNVNDGYAAAWGSVDAPMGGFGDSGLGRRHGARGLLQLVEPQTIATQRLLGFSAPPGVPDRVWARVLASAIAGMKRAGRR